MSLVCSENDPEQDEAYLQFLSRRQVDGFMKLKDQLAELGVEPIFLSADSQRSNAKFRTTMRLPEEWPLLSDVDHAVADQYTIPISRKHPQSKKYADGFIQPAVFVYGKDEPMFTFIQKPGMMNLWGASGRPSPKQVVAAVRKAMG